MVVKKYLILIIHNEVDLEELYSKYDLLSYHRL